MKLIRIPEAAARLDVSVARAYELARTGTIPTVRLGRQLRVDPRKLDQWIDDGGARLGAMTVVEQVGGE